LDRNISQEKTQENKKIGLPPDNLFLVTYFKIWHNTVFTCVLCAPVYNTHPYFGLHFEKEKKSEAENRGSGYEKIA